MTERDEIALAIALRHARNNLVPAWPGRRCIDGRYEPGQATGTIARPGADLGYVLALLAVGHERDLGLTPAAVVDAVYRAVTADGGTFFLHTDEFTGLPGPAGSATTTLIGCRHVAAAAEPDRSSDYFPATYHEAADDVRAAVAAVLRRREEGGRVQIVTLRGVSSEQGVLVVTGTDRTVNPACAHSAYFVYDQTRDDAFVADVLIPRLAIDGLIADDLIAHSRRQLAASLCAVASGKPVFAIDADGAEPVVTVVGCVEKSGLATASFGIPPALAKWLPGSNQDEELPPRIQ
jgi:hypothetical protein